jgi:hypothetical protein
MDIIYSTNPKAAKLKETYQNNKDWIKSLPKDQTNQDARLTYWPYYHPVNKPYWNDKYNSKDIKTVNL